MSTLEEISSHLEQGYFLKEDMDFLGLTGYVSVADVRTKVRGMLVPKQVTPETAASAEADRANKAQLELQAQAQEAAVRAAAVQAVNDKREADRQALLAQQDVQQAVERFHEALKADPNVQKTP